MANDDHGGNNEGRIGRLSFEVEKPIDPEKISTPGSGCLLAGQGGADLPCGPRASCTMPNEERAGFAFQARAHDRRWRFHWAGEGGVRRRPARLVFIGRNLNRPQTAARVRRGAAAD